MFCFKIVVDNLALSDILNGYDVLQDPTLHDSCHRITEVLEGWRKRGWVTACEGGDPVEWRYRELNTEADRCCNWAFKQNGSHKWLNYRHKETGKAGFNLFMQSDGGSRGGRVRVRPSLVQNRCQASRDKWDSEVRELCSQHGLIYQVRKRISFAPCYTTNDHFTKTGSGQT